MFDERLLYVLEVVHKFRGLAKTMSINLHELVAANIEVNKERSPARRETFSLYIMALLSGYWCRVAEIY